ncbi:DinB family protein [Flavobacterium sp. DG1-102-2]|uniref:DinB family protein n=1 Tax=Flavobacterium sp. DG1-102-2 TaxID=3081663 RepID=UPI00294989FC|nr:DinB family protein [Flavobacterium sp. DG1-102-2]MDV6169607.1 DinB family protein [Flavobacterium sp. DG1-102-2]
MEKEFKITRTSRDIYAKLLNDFTLDQLNKIPDGWSNNLMWHIGHIVVSQQALVYKGSGIPMQISDKLMAMYMRGTKPERDVTQDEVDEIKSLLFSTIQKTEEDYRNGIFTTYNARKSEMGFDLSDTEDAIAFNNQHEGMHLGMVIRLKKLV